MSAFPLVRTAVLVTLATSLSSPAVAQWQPPIGIPSPSFGISETAPASPSPWAIATPGFYYVDATSGAATDSGNAYGTPARPRRTIPISLPAGAVVELHGTYDTSHGSPNTIVANGTSARPVFIRGVSDSSRPLVRRNWEVKGSYLILENIYFGPTSDNSTSGTLVIRLPADHVALRHSEVHGTPSDGGIGINNWEVPYGVPYTGSGTLNNIVIYDNYIHDNGDINAKYDQDVHGIGVSDHVHHLWVVDNEIARNSGDGIQINAQAGQGATTHHIYVGRNVSHHNKQTGFWVKQATDVIFSQNETYGHRPSDSSQGQGMGAQYATEYVWFLFNRIHDNEYGIHQASDSGEPSHTFIIGNVIYNIHGTTSGSSPGSAWGPSAIMMSGGNERHVVNNTIYDVDGGVNSPSTVGTLDLVDNIIANVTLPRSSHVNLEMSSLASRATFHHSLLYSDARMAWGGAQQKLSLEALKIAYSTSLDPQFMNAAGGDLRIGTSSAAANAGVVDNVYLTFQQRYGLSILFDAAGNARPASGSTDMGAYVAGGSTAPTPTPTPPTPPPPQPPTGPACPSTGGPGAPTNLALVKQGGGELTLSWNKPTSCGAATSYVLEGGTSPGDVDAGAVDVADGTTTTGPLAPGTFYVRLKSKNAAGTGPPSNEVTVGGVPGPPRNLRVIVTKKIFTATWDPPTTGGTASGYIVEGGSKPGATDYGAVLSTETKIEGPSQHNVYYIRVRAASIAGVSDPSNEVYLVAK